MRKDLFSFLRIALRFASDESFLINWPNNSMAGHSLYLLLSHLTLPYIAPIIAINPLVIPMIDSILIFLMFVIIVHPLINLGKGPLASIPLQI